MTDQPARLARTAGALYLAMMPFGFFAIVYLPSILLVPGDATATLQRVAGAETLIRLGTASHLIGQLLFLCLVLTLYRLLAPVQRARAILMVMLATIGISLTLYNEVHHLSALGLVQPAMSAGWSAEQLASLVTQHLAARAHGILLSQVFWGLWLLPLGALVIQAGWFPRLIGPLLLLAGLGYLIDVSLQLLLPSVTLRVSAFTFIGEVVFPVWLLVRGAQAAVGPPSEPIAGAYAV